MQAVPFNLPGLNVLNRSGIITRVRAATCTDRGQYGLYSYRDQAMLLSTFRILASVL